MRTLILIFIVLTVSGFSCGRKEVIREPGEVVYRDRIVVQPVAPGLLVEHEVATGPLSQCPNVAADRKRALELCNAQIREIRESQGD